MRGIFEVRLPGLDILNSIRHIGFALPFDGIKSPLVPMNGEWREHIWSTWDGCGGSSGVQVQQQQGL